MKKIKFTVKLTAILITALLFSACQQKTLSPLPADNINNQEPVNLSNSSLTPQNTSIKQDRPSTEKLLNIKANQQIQAVIKTNLGSITLRLFADKAPETVANFIGLAEGKIKKGNQFYNNTIFHRVIKGFMIQGGDPEGTGRGGPGYTFADEIDPNLTFDKAGILAMANRGPNTNGSQFFITLAPTPWLNGKHTIFGKVIDGMDIVEKIGQVETGPNNRPLKDVIIETIQITRESLK